jgi:transcriptional regulator with XRE-family HTH domain
MKSSDQKRFKARGDNGSKPKTLQARFNVSAKDLRIKLGLTQSEFWAPVGVSQSGGSRYESGRKLPVSISTLLYLVHVEHIDLAMLVGDDVLVGQYLSQHEPKTFATLLAAAKALKRSEVRCSPGR